MPDAFAYLVLKKIGADYATCCRRLTIGSYVLRRFKFGRTSCAHEEWCRASANTSDILFSTLT
jgi:hypothetical protein